MPESMAKRLKRLEQRVNRVAPGSKRQLFYMNVPRDEYEAAMAILSDLPVVVASAPDSKDRLAPSERPLEPRKAESAPQKPQRKELPKESGSRSDEFSDAAVLRKARSGLLETIDFHGGNTPW